MVYLIAQNQCFLNVLYTFFGYCYLLVIQFHDVLDENLNNYSENASCNTSYSTSFKIIANILWILHLQSYFFVAGQMDGADTDSLIQIHDKLCENHATSLRYLRSSIHRQKAKKTKKAPPSGPYRVFNRYMTEDRDTLPHHNGISTFPQYHRG